jgi:hypothetical protein
MKKTLLLTIVFMLFMSVNGYSLGNFYYTGIAFDGSGNILYSQTISVKIELITSTGPQPKYSEDHASVTTDQFGSYFVEVGTGTNQTGSLAGINATKDLKIKSTTSGTSGGVWVISSILKPTVAITGGSNNLYWKLNGNNGTTAGTHYLGTDDNKPFELRVQNSGATYVNSLFLGINNDIYREGNGSTSGNTRGISAVDLQSSRTSADQVASGNYSVIGGGSSNKANGNSSTVSGGNENTAGGDYSTIGGGSENTASANYSTIPGGYQAVADKYAQKAYAAGSFSSAGDAQTSIFVVRNTTTDLSTTASLYLDGNSIQMTLNDQDAWAFSAYVVGKSDDGTNRAAFIVRGIILRDGTNTTINGVSTTTIYDSSGGSYSATAVADNTNEALDIQVTGDGTNTMRWVARVEVAQLNY